MVHLRTYTVTEGTFVDGLYSSVLALSCILPCRIQFTVIIYSVVTVVIDPVTRIYRHVHVQFLQLRPLPYPAAGTSPLHEFTEPR